MPHHVILTLGDFTVYALAGEGGPARGQLRTNALRALRYYLGDRDSGRTDWPCPRFLPDIGGAARVDLDLTIDEELWQALSDEAARQGVEPERLAEHAALYFAASRDAGRVDEEMLEVLDEGSGGP
jgi:hypothetical protein